MLPTRWKCMVDGILSVRISYLEALFSLRLSNASVSMSVAAQIVVLAWMLYRDVFLCLVRLQSSPFPYLDAGRCTLTT